MTFISSFLPFHPSSNTFQFDDVELHPLVSENIRLVGYTRPTPVQRFSLPIVMSGLDLMACAQTGSGKTAAFLLPMITHLLRQSAAIQPTLNDGRFPTAHPQILVLAPTRELASQIFDEARKFCYRSWVAPAVVYGGADMGGQMREIRAGGADLLVATPGRLIDMCERGVISLVNVKYAVENG